MISSTLTLCNTVFHFRCGDFHFLILLLICHPAFAPMTISDILCRNPASPHNICSLVCGIVCIPSSATTLLTATPCLAVVCFSHWGGRPQGFQPHIFQGFSLFKLQTTFFPLLSRQCCLQHRWSLPLLIPAENPTFSLPAGKPMVLVCFLWIQVYRSEAEVDKLLLWSPDSQSFPFNLLSLWMSTNQQALIFLLCSCL